MRLDALLARREALGGDPHEVKQLAKELSGALDAELKARERENERKKKRCVFIRLFLFVYFYFLPYAQLVY